MTLTLDIEHDESTSTLQILAPDDLGDADTPSLQSARIERALTRQPDATDTAEAVVYRDAWNDIETGLDRTNDRLVIREDGDIVFGGRLADFEREGVVVSVLIDGPKRDAIDAEPSGGNDVFEPQPDSTLVENELLSRVPTVDAGTVETVDNAIAFSESHASPGKSLTKLARDADAEVRYRATETGFELDYVERFGRGRTDETLSPSSATVLGEPRIREQITEDVTHVRVLGAGEGTAQVEAEAVASAFDPADDRPVYRQRVDKDIADVGRAESLAETLVAEYDGAPEYLEVELEVPRQVEPSVGDEFALELPAHEIDTTLRVTTAERVVDADGDRYRVVLSNRRHTAALTGDEKAVELDSLSEGNAGQYYALADGEGWDAVASDEDYEFSFYRPPNTIGELRSTLRLESRPYRLRASQEGHEHDVDIGSTSTANTDQDTIVTSDVVFTEAELTRGVDPEWHTLQTVFGDLDFNFENVDVSRVWLYLSIRTFELYLDGTETEDERISLRFRLYNQDTGEYYPTSRGLAIETQSPGSGRLSHSVVPITEPSDPDANVEAQAALFSGFQDVDEIRVDIQGDARWLGEGRHTHDVSETTTTSSTAAVEPGIVEQTNETVSNVDVTVAGETVATGLDHPIDETIGVGGVLTDGRNDIQITSDSLGELRATLEYEALKNASRDAL